MKIGIIGAGNIGAILAKRLATLGHDIKIANSRGPASLTELTSQRGVRVVTVQDAVHDVELVIVTIPERAVPALPAGLFATLAASVAVVDTGNYYPPRDGRIEPIERGQTESGWVADVLGHAVVKAFNNITAHSLATKGRPPGSPDRIALPFAGSDAAAKQRVAGLIDELGFDAVDAGDLESSWRQQPGTPAYATDYSRPELLRALERADRASAPQRRDAGLSMMMSLPSDTTPDQIIALARKLADG